MLELIQEAFKDSLLYGCPTNTKIERNLLTVKVNSDIFVFDFLNGKIETVWYNGIKLPLTLHEKFEITLLLYEF